MSVSKLKHISLKEIHYQLMNKTLIIYAEAKDYCCCWAFQGCREKPQIDNLIGARNYCYLCQLMKEYTPHRVERLRTIQETWQLYLKLVKDLKSVDYMLYPIFWNRNYYDKFKEYKLQLVKKIAIREYITYCYEYLVWLDP